MQPTEADIRERSYFIWEREGRPAGRAWDHWFRAEAELRASEAIPRPRRTRTAAGKAGPAGERKAGSKRSKG